jgi:death-on-curing protein
VSEWRWLSLDAAAAIHEEQLAEHGGAGGTRNEAGLESALARPQNVASYGNPDAASLAASYAYGIVRNHPFVDGNKRTGWVLCQLFLAKNGLTMTFQDADAVVRMLALAAGEISEEQFADWLRERLSAV